MLKAVIQQVKLAGECSFGEQAGLVSVSAYDHRRLQLARNQKRFIAKLRLRAVRIDNCDSGRSATVTARENIEGDSALGQQLAQRDHEWRLTAAADRNIPDAHHRTCQLLHLKSPAIVQGISYGYASTEDGRKWVHRGCSCCCKSGASAVRVRRVAP